MKNFTTRISLALLFVFPVLFLGACSRHVKQDAENILLFTLDTTRADHLGCYGYEIAQTPVLDRLAAEGVVYENAFCNVPLTLPSHTTMLTGLLPPEHGLRINGEKSLNPSVPTLQKLFKKEGYDTAAFLASYVLNAKFGLAPDFDVYNDDVNLGDDETGLRSYRPGDEVVEAVLPWLNDSSRRRSPFFCWIHLFDPHKPYHAHEDLFGDRFKLVYDAEVAFMDMQIGRVIDAVEKNGLRTNTWLIFVGDHGESLGEHGELYHGNTLYNSAIHVPFIIVPPTGKDAGGRRIPENVSLNDLFPTIVSIFDLQVEDDIERKGWVVYPDVPGKPRTLYAETLEPFYQYGWSPLAAVISNHWKYIKAPREELYDMHADSGEIRNIIQRYPGVYASLKDQLQLAMDTMNVQVAEHVAMTDEERRTLESLGYSAGGSGAASIDGPQVSLPDVKDMLPKLNKMMHALTLMRDNNIAEAVEVTTPIAEEHPENPTFQLVYAEALFRAHKMQQAHAALIQLLENEWERLTIVQKADALNLDGKVLHSMGRLDEAAEQLSLTLDVDGNNLVAMNGLSWILATAPNRNDADRQRAVELAEKAVRLSGREKPEYLDTLSVAYAAVGKMESAVQISSEAETLAAAHGKQDLVESIQRRLHHWQSKALDSH